MLSQSVFLKKNYFLIIEMKSNFSLSHLPCHSDIKFALYHIPCLMAVVLDETVSDPFKKKPYQRLLIFIIIFTYTLKMSWFWTFLTLIASNFLKNKNVFFEPCLVSFEPQPHCWAQPQSPEHEVPGLQACSRPVCFDLVSFLSARDPVYTRQALCHWAVPQSPHPIYFLIA